MHSRNRVVAPPSRLVILEGNISAGKSSLAKSLGEYLQYKVFLEPTLSNPYLDSFYKDPQRWALPMQIWLLTQRYHTYVTAVSYVLETGGGAILDRSIYSDWVFAERNRLDGNIPEEGYKYYMALRQRMLADLPPPHAMLYLDVSAAECYTRVRHLRQRECESGIPLEYLQGLDDVYRRFAQQMEQCGTTVLRLDWQTFGDTATVAELVNNAPLAEQPWAAAAQSQWLREFLADPKQIAARTKLEAPAGWRVPAECCSLASAADADMELRAEEKAAAHPLEISVVN